MSPSRAAKPTIAHGAEMLSGSGFTPDLRSNLRKCFPSISAGVLLQWQSPAGVLGLKVRLETEHRRPAPRRRVRPCHGM
jgi:hypothetical protein